jgi:hypothetical protein
LLRLHAGSVELETKATQRAETFFYAHELVHNAIGHWDVESGINMFEKAIATLYQKWQGSAKATRMPGWIIKVVERASDQEGRKQEDLPGLA